MPERILDEVRLVIDAAVSIALFHPAATKLRRAVERIPADEMRPISILHLTLRYSK